MADAIASVPPENDSVPLDIVQIAPLSREQARATSWQRRHRKDAWLAWTGLTGELFHVASGGSRRMDDVTSGSGPTAQTGMGSPSTGFDSLPAGAQQMWQNEYFYLDGTVVLHQNQGWPSVGLIVEPRTWQQITDDVDTAPTATNGVLRYGLVRDTGNDGAPVPQYLTRDTPTDPATVPQQSAVS